MVDAISLMSSLFSLQNGTASIAVDPPSHLRIALSGVSSSTSLACWIVLLLPQLIEQWKLKSSEGIALNFIIMWFVADVANLIGSVWANLLPGVILLATWFCIADGLLITSYMYYKNNGSANGDVVGNGTSDTHVKHSGSSPIAAQNGSLDANAAENDPTQPLLNGNATAAVTASLRRSSRNSRRKSSHRRRRDSLASIVIAPATSSTSIFTQYVLPVLFVFAAGIVGYLLSSGDTEDSAPPGNGGDEEDITIGTGPQLLGYLSAVLYLGARLPQIYQNHQKRSVYGLSLLFFMFSMLGNITYSGGILLYRSDPHYIKLYFPWLLGSLGTIFEDLIIMLQFYLYNRADNSNESAILE